MGLSIHHKVTTGSGCSSGFLGWILLSAGIFFLSLAIFKDIRLAFFGQRAQAIITDIRPFPDYDSDPSASSKQHDSKSKDSGYLYTLTFTPKGRSVPLSVEALVPEGASSKKGDQVEVVYLKGSPEDAEIYSTHKLWLPPLTSFMASAFCLVCGVFLIRMDKSTEKSAA